jgi:hypothetical protein
MSFAYRKNKNPAVFASLEAVVGMSNLQNYIPLYNVLFELNSTNWNNINLDITNALSEVHGADGPLYAASVNGADRKKVFFKHCPLFDPSKYLLGSLPEFTLSLPTLTPSVPKLDHEHNAAYVDGMFYYLTSRLLHTNKFIHGIDFYGAFLGIKENFKYYGEDDPEMLMSSTFFMAHLGEKFEINHDITTPSDSRNFKSKIEFADEIDTDMDIEEIDPDIVELDPTPAVPVDQTVDVVEEFEPLETDDLSYNSSTSSNTPCDFVDPDHPEVEDPYDSSPESLDDDLEDFCVTIKQFPVQVVAMEGCESTLDKLLDHIEAEELESALMQIIMMLITYQKVYQFTHNDLHTNNVMYVPTDTVYLHYRFNNTNYKVPTFGKIFKIIDFGRAIYTFNGRKYVSDSFGPQGDASCQYNTEPFVSPSKPVLDPNPSFDLCRLACSMIDTLPNTAPYKNLNALIHDWCCDDKGRNVMFKRSGEERYPNFKLYKMIARTVHHHLPTEQLKRPMFAKYASKRGHPTMMNIDLF